MMEPTPWADADLARIENLKNAKDKIMEQLRKAIVGLDTVISQVMVALFSQGHALLMGVPGIGKTLLVRSLAASLSLEFKRVQFTPDLMPSDITGTEVIEENRTTGERQFRFLKGPVFTNVLLADEINRTPPKTQAALLEAMQERQVTVSGERYDLDAPFFVLATQNPIEQEGTYPLPEAQLDRFMFMIHVGYPNEAEELDILALTTTGYEPDITPVLGADEIIALQKLVRQVNVPMDVMKGVVRLVQATRITEPSAPDFVKKWVSWGASPRASQNLILGAKARAILDGRSEIQMADALAMAQPVLNHRVILNFAAQAEGMTPIKLVDDLVAAVA